MLRHKKLNEPIDEKPWIRILTRIPTKKKHPFSFEPSLMPLKSFLTQWHARRYDATGTTSSTANTNNARNPFQWHFTTRRQRTQLKDHFKVKEAKLRVMHVVSLAQLETVMLNDEDKLERHLLMCFITPSTEQYNGRFHTLSISLCGHVDSRHLVGRCSSDGRRETPYSEP